MLLKGVMLIIRLTQKGLRTSLCDWFANALMRCSAFPGLEDASQIGVIPDNGTNTQSAIIWGSYLAPPLE